MTITVPLFRPFAALRPAPARAADVAAPPYDVLSSDEARVQAQGKPWSFLHISKAEIDLPAGVDIYAPEVYAKAAENLTGLVKAGVLVRDAKPCYYAYRLTMGAHVQTGIAAAGSVADYVSNRIRKHEFTRPDKEDDRVRQIEAVNAQTGPVLLAHPTTPAVAAVLKKVTATPATYDFTAPDGIGHALWVIDGDADIKCITDTFAAMKAVYIADGHHRSAAASRVCAARKAANPKHQGDESYNSFLVVSFPAEEMMILDYNRVVKDLNGMDRAAFLKALESEFVVTPVGLQARPDAQRVFGLYLKGQWYKMTPKNPLPPENQPVARLDVSLLTDRLLSPVLGIHDLRKDKRIDFVGGKRGLGELERRVDSGEMAAAFALYPTSMADLMSVADADAVMPPKSTWFEPKLADGLLSLVLD